MLAARSLRHAALAAWVAVGVASCERDHRASREVSGSPGPDAAPEPVASASAVRAPLSVEETGPSGTRVRVRRPVTVRFDREVSSDERAAVARSVAVTPPGRLVPDWPDARTLTLAPAGGWAPGRLHHVEIGGDGTGVARTAWSFRARVPRPRSVTPGGGARAILTFDDAPARHHQADELLDVLRRLEVRALFFPTGVWARLRPAWVERAVREGHRVCNHTLSHVDLTSRRLTEEDVRREIGEGATDGECRLFRPPLMAIDERAERVAADLGWELFLWDVDPRDWDGLEARDLVHAVLGRIRPDAVVLFHVHAPNTVAALPELVARLRRAGYVPSWDPADSPGAVEAGQPGLREAPARRWADALRSLDGGTHGPASPSSLP
ncbi:MAG: polysaccharide deacetylase family protein [Polyangiaceae bacterium]|nr:polysaccharide deacetylase family protein [Polyangiaceae bacterium]